MGRELRQSHAKVALSPHRWCGVAPPENSVTNSRADCALTQQMIGCIKAISPCVKSASAKLFLDLHTVLAPSGEERTLEEAAQVERAAWCCGQRRVILRSGRAVGPWYPKFEKENPFCIAGVLAATEPLPLRSVRVEGSVVRVEGSAVRVEG